MMTSSSIMDPSDVAKAYRDANDEDTRQVLNAMAARGTKSSLNGLKFYVVPRKWMQKAWPFLTTGFNGAGVLMEGTTAANSCGWKEQIGLINNSVLLENNSAVSVSSSSDEEEDEQEDGRNGGSGASQMAQKLREQKRLMKKRNRKKIPPSLRRDIRHERDFCLLGPNAWRVVKKNFELDTVELSRRCVYPKANDNTLAVILHENETISTSTGMGTSTDNNDNINNNAAAVSSMQKGNLRSYSFTSSGQVKIPVPPSGRFAYEKLFSNLSASDDTSNSKHNALEVNRKTMATDVVSDDDTFTNELAPTASDAAIPQQSSTSTEEQQQQHLEHSQGPLILLPPSTTTSSPNGSDLYPSFQDMDVQGQRENLNDNEDDKKEETSSLDNGGNDSNFTIAPVARTPQSTWKQYGSGLGNLGNTCFMNSTLQCLAHTYPLRRYFLSGEYERDLNRVNPLGTGGDLAVHFAQLLGEMWGTTPGAPITTSISGSRRTVLPSNKYANSSSNATAAVNTSSVIYPRSFKYTLGKHAEQFMGYDQHDSQELATYLLDALHEDTNRVTKKPYIEKPEKGEDEPDDVAARKAWDLHLQREDSRVLENFMGQVKSRVQCCEDGCNRVSTTFDPFMFLSVPIPGSTERTIQVTFIPSHREERMKSVSVVVSKAASISTLLHKVNQQLTKYNSILGTNSEPIPLEDLCPVDVWSHEVYTWYNNDDDVERIRDSDITFVYQLRPVSEIHDIEKEVDAASDKESEDAIALGLRTSPRSNRYKLDISTLTRLNRQDEWMTVMENYLRNRTQLYGIFNHKRGCSTSDQFAFYQKLESFLDLCIKDCDSDKAGIKRAREDSPSNSNLSDFDSLSATTVSPDDDAIPVLGERCESNQTFCHVRTRYDIAVLEFCLGKLRQYILDLSKGVDKTKYKDGFLIQVILRRSNKVGEKSFASPLVLRLPASTTVYGLREELARRLSRSLKTGELQSPEHANISDADPETTTSAPSDDKGNNNNSNNIDNEITDDNDDVVPMELEGEAVDDSSENNYNGSIDNYSQAINATHGGDLAMLIMRQIPMSYMRKNSYKGSSKPIGMLERGVEGNNSHSYGSTEGNNRVSPISLASPTDEDERQLLTDVLPDGVGPKGSVLSGTVFLDWPYELCERAFDLAEYETLDDVKDVIEKDEGDVGGRTRKSNRGTTVLDCVEKYCQMEQLEETEKWYCNRCKSHVRAWKQFHLYRTPPILIVHLKRFHYSAQTHRRDKISAFIDFPISGLDLTEHVMHWTESEKPIYDCYAVSNHYGGLGGGHYTAYALNDDGIWCHYDDSRISTHVDPKEVISEAAYVLYYRRRDVIINDDFYRESLLDVSQEQDQQMPAVVQDNQDQPHQHHSHVNVVGVAGISEIGGREPSEISSSNGAQIGEDEDMDVDETDAASRGSSKTCSSPLGSVQGEIVEDHDYNAAVEGGEAFNLTEKYSDYPLQ